MLQLRQACRNNDCLHSITVECRLKAPNGKISGPAVSALQPTYIYHGPTCL